MEWEMFASVKLHVTASPLHRRRPLPRRCHPRAAGSASECRRHASMEVGKASRVQEQDADEWHASLPDSWCRMYCRKTG